LAKQMAQKVFEGDAKHPMVQVGDLVASAGDRGGRRRRKVFNQAASPGYCFATTPEFPLKR